MSACRQRDVHVVHASIEEDFDLKRAQSDFRRRSLCACAQHFDLLLEDVLAVSQSCENSYLQMDRSGHYVPPKPIERRGSVP